MRIYQIILCSKSTLTTFQKIPRVKWQESTLKNGYFTKQKLKCNTPYASANKTINQQQTT